MPGRERDRFGRPHLELPDDQQLDLASYLHARQAPVPRERSLLVKCM
jgi:hypothetical protein